MISDQEYKKAIININHSSDNMKECMIKNAVQQTEQHNALLVEMKDQKQEMIMLRKDTNSMLTVMMKENSKIILAMIGVVSASIAVFALIVKVL